MLRRSSRISAGLGRARVRLVAAALRRRLGDLRQLLLGDAEVAQAIEAAEERELARALDGIGADRLAEARDLARERTAS